MANNFRLIGTSYISKDGNDGNSGLTADLPKVTLANYGGTQIVGCGVYKGAFNLSTNIQTRSYISDGYVKILCTADLPLTQPNGGTTVAFNTDTEGNYIEIVYQGFKVIQQAGNFITYRTIHRDGIFESNTTAPSDIAFYKSVLESITTNNCYMHYVFDKTLLFNSTLNFLHATTADNSIITNSYIDSGTTISMTAYYNTPATRFLNNNFQGKFNIGGVLYELKREKDGTAIDPNPAVLDIIGIDATVYDRGNFSQSPEFNNIEKRDYFSVSNTSPMLFGADDATNIGNVKSAVTFTTADTEISTGTVTDLVLSSGDYIVDLPATTGQNENLAMQIAPIAQVVESIDLAALLNFDSLEVAGTAENTMITIVDNYATATAGANPRRLTYKMRWSSQDAEPTTPAEYDNNGFVTAGDFSKFEQFAQPLIDVASMGNGEPTFNTTGASPIKAKWIQVIEVMNDGIG